MNGAPSAQVTLHELKPLIRVIGAGKRHAQKHGRDQGAAVLVGHGGQRDTMLEVEGEGRPAWLRQEGEQVLQWAAGVTAFGQGGDGLKELTRGGRVAESPGADGERTQLCFLTAALDVDRQNTRALLGHARQDLFHVRGAEPLAARQVDGSEIRPRHAPEHGQHVGPRDALLAPAEF